MRMRHVIMGLVLASTMLPAFALPAKAQSCHQLWVERNEIYKARGYCFKTSRAISYFGNAGCVYDNERDIPLSRSERARVADIQAEERAMGCR